MRKRRSSRSRSPENQKTPAVTLEGSGGEKGRKNRGCFDIFRFTTAIIIFAAVTYYVGLHVIDADGDYPPQYKPSEDGLYVRSPYTTNSTQAFESNLCNDNIRRALTFLSLDKPVYKAGDDDLRARLVILNEENFAPIGDQTLPRAPIEMKIYGPKGDVVKTITKSAYGRDSYVRSSFGMNWLRMPPNLAGGQYRAVVRYEASGVVAAERAFEVRASGQQSASAPKLNLQIEFAKKGYAPGDRVEAVLTSRRLDGVATQGARVRATARMDGRVLFESDSACDVGADGKCDLGFELPTEIADGSEGTLSLVVFDKGVVEARSKTLPLILVGRDLRVRTFPESGVLVSGLESRVYVEIRTHRGDPADMRGDIVELRAGADDGAPGLVVASMETSHEGRGRSSKFVPTRGKRYVLRITDPPRPLHLRQSVRIPSLETGDLKHRESRSVTLTSSKDVFESDEPVHVVVRSRHRRSLRVGLFKREREIAHAVLECGGDGDDDVACPVSLASDDAAAGVLRVTVFGEAEGQDAFRGSLPLAERLVFRRPSEQLRIEVSGRVVYDEDDEEEIAFEHGRLRASPGDTVELKVRTSQAGVVGITVTDAAVRAAIEPRRTAPSLPAMAWFESEIESPTLYDADTFERALAKSADADRAVDLLLGTQGWRRFSYEDPMAFFEMKNDGDDNTEDGDNDDDAKLTETQRKDARERIMAVHEAPIKVNFAMARDFAIPPQAEMMMAMPMMKAGMAAPKMEMRAMRVGAGAPPHVAEAAVADDAQEAGPPGGIVERRGLPKIPMPERVPPAQRLPFRKPRPLKKRPRAPKMMQQAVPPPFKREVRPEYRRVYAHEAHTYTRRDFERGPLVRSDFQETVFWDVGAETQGEEHSEVTVRFALSDSLTTFNVLVDGWASSVKSGALGVSRDFSIQSELPLSVDIKAPGHLMRGDRLLLPVVLSSSGAASNDALELDVKISTPGSAPPRLVLKIDADDADDDGWHRRGVSDSAYGATKASAPDHERTYVPMRAVAGSGTKTMPPVDNETISSRITVSASTRRASDAIRRNVQLSFPGFPVSLHKGGLIGSRTTGNLRGDVDAFAPFDFTIADDADLSSLRISAKAFPNPVGSLTEALEALIRNPCGCFEQTSSTTYPLVMALAYLKDHRDGSKRVEDMIRDIEAKLRKGYNRLVSFESSDGGFEWFGGSPGHEALTAYGVAQFKDMQRVLPGLVDETMLKRTESWLLSRRDEKGGFERNAKALDSFGRASASTTDAYITFSLLREDNSEELRKEIEALERSARVSEDAYLSALAALALYRVGRANDARVLAKNLASHQEDDGSVLRTSETITVSGGISKTLETTALAALAWMESDAEFADHTRRAIEFIVASCKGGRFGSTQATVLSLRAIVEYEKLQRGTDDTVGGGVRLTFDGRTVDTRRFAIKSNDGNDGSDDTVDGVLTFDTSTIVRALREGEQGLSHRLKLDFVDGARSTRGIPYAMSVDFVAINPRENDRCGVRLSTRWASTGDQLRAQTTEGDLVQLRVTVENVAAAPIDMVVARVGIPAGLEPRMDQLRELREAGAVAFVEIRKGEAALYWRGFDKGQRRDVVLDLEAAVPGTFTAKSSSAYLYYTDEYKRWERGLVVDVAPRVE